MQNVGTSLFPFKISIVSPIEIAGMIKNYAEASTKFRCQIVGAIDNAMRSSKEAAEYISFVAQQPGFSLEYMPMAKARSIPGFLIDAVNAFYSPHKNSMFFTDHMFAYDMEYDRAYDTTILHEFWHAFVSNLQIANDKTLAHCNRSAYRNALSYPFMPPMITRRARDYKRVAAVYANFVSFQETLSWPVHNGLSDFLYRNRHSLGNGLHTYEKQYGAVSSALDFIKMAQYLIVESLKAKTSKCADHIKVLHRIYGIGSYINITDPSLLKQFPGNVTNTLANAARNMAGINTPLAEKELIKKLLESSYSTEEAQEIYANIITLDIYSQRAIIECDAMLMEIFPLIRSMPEHQTLMHAHRKEIQKAIVCNPHWERALSAMPRPKLPQVHSDICTMPSAWNTALSSAGIGLAFSVAAQVVESSASKPIYKRLALYGGKAGRLMGHCMTAFYFADAPFVGVATFAAGEGLAYLSARAGIPAAIPNIANNAYSISGLLYSAYEDINTFGISVAAGVVGQSIGQAGQYLYGQYRGQSSQQSASSRADSGTTHTHKRR